MNIFTVGTRRDSEKWGSRDRRKDPDKLDLIHFDLFNPYIVSRIVNGINILNELAEKTPKTQDYISYKGLNIHRLLLKTSRKYYEMALKIFIGQELIKRLDGINSTTSAGELTEKIKTQGKEGRGKWVDFCGLITPLGKIEALIDSVKTGNIKSLDDLNNSLLEMYNNYGKYTWEWCSGLIESQLGIDLANITASSLLPIIADWKLNAVKFNNMILKDAEKEFDTSTRLGFGIDGDENTRDQDFLAVRGSYDENKFVIGLKKETIAIEEKADRIINILEKIQ
jgi:hypothetical protein